MSVLHVVFEEKKGKEEGGGVPEGGVGGRRDLSDPERGAIVPRTPPVPGGTVSRSYVQASVLVPVTWKDRDPLRPSPPLSWTLLPSSILPGLD